jgi:ribosome-associated heat shock protein Hsp15
MADEAPAAMRLDRFLWFARIVKTRPFAQTLASAGQLRIDGRAVERPSTPVRVGDVLTFADHRGAIRTIRILALPRRRGPAVEARACYVDLANVSQHASGD